ncbi:hypothetical protein V2G26_017263 [Clonostachys chloroleuca]
MTIVVTGGAGFLGHHLVKLLLEKGKSVVVMDSLWTGSQENIAEFASNPKFRHILCDVREPLPDVEDLEQIYHLACPASPDDFERAPIEILETCFLGTRNVLELATVRRARVLLASTSEVYGDPEISVLPESYRGNVNSFGPRSCYDEGKRILEALAFSYRLKNNVETRIARIFNAYGPYMAAKDGRAVPNFIGAAMDGQPVKIYGDGSATRCFQYATDCVEGLYALMNSDYDKPVNIGSDLEMTVSVIANKVTRVVAEKLGQKAPVAVQYLPKRVDDPTRRKPDITLAREVLGWSPKVSLDDGIAQTVDWFLEKHRNPKSLM